MAAVDGGCIFARLRKGRNGIVSFCLVVFGGAGCLFLVGSVRRCSSDADYAGGTKGLPIE